MIEINNNNLRQLLFFISNLIIIKQRFLRSSILWVRSNIMEEVKSFNQIINDFYIEVELSKGEPNEISFILVQNRRQQCFELKFGNSSMPAQLRALFKDVEDLFNYLSYFKDNRSYFDIFPSGSLKLVKQIDENSCIGIKTLQLLTYPVKVKQPSSEHQNLPDRIYLGSEQNCSQISNFKSYRNMNEIMRICSQVTRMIRDGLPEWQISRIQRIKRATVQKMISQFRLYGTIYPPKNKPILNDRNVNNFYQPSFKQKDEYYISQHPNEEQYYNINQGYQQAWSQQPQRQLGPVTPNMKMHGDAVKAIKSMLTVLVREGKMQSLDQMRNFLLEKNIDRSLSSIYRYIQTIKNQNEDLRGRNYTMYKKDLEAQLPNPKPQAKTTVTKNLERIQQ